MPDRFLRGDMVALRSLGDDPNFEDCMSVLVHRPDDCVVCRRSYKGQTSEIGFDAAMLRRVG